MATTSAAIGCALLALLLWVPVGWLIARRLPLDPDLRVAAAPILGWAMQGIVAIWICTLGGFSTATILAATAVVCVAAISGARPAVDHPTGHRFPLWAFFAIALVAIAPALAVLPKIMPEGVAVSAPIYDHSKVALVDEMVRTGLPPANPFIGGNVEPGSVAYYYFWLFATAQLALVSGASGWEADIAATWFTAFASLLLMCGLAFRAVGAAPAQYCVRARRGSRWLASPGARRALRASAAGCRAAAAHWSDGLACAVELEPSPRRSGRDGRPCRADIGAARTTARARAHARLSGACGGGLRQLAMGWRRHVRALRRRCRTDTARSCGF